VSPGQGNVIGGNGIASGLGYCCGQLLHRLQFFDHLIALGLNVADLRHPTSHLGMKLCLSKAQNGIGREQLANAPIRRHEVANRPDSVALLPCRKSRLQNGCSCWSRVALLAATSNHESDSQHRDRE